MSVIIHAPCTGWLRRLDEVPDPAFAGRMVGDGLAIDPLEGLLVAPCAGSVVTLAPTAHALSLRTAGGIDLLLHIGIDTVKLGGTGFTPMVKSGATVSPGEPLIAFDLEQLARLAPSLMIPIIVTSLGMVVTQLAPAGAIRRGVALFGVAPADRAENTGRGDPGAGEILTRTIALPLPNGLHARPAARIARLCRTFEAKIWFDAAGKRADGDSMTALLALGASHGDELRISARGTDARQALEAIVALVESGIDEPDAPPSSDAAPVARERLRAAQIAGVKAAPGIAVGAVFVIAGHDREIAERGTTAEAETMALAEAVGAVAARIEASARAGTAAARTIAEAHRELLGDGKLHRAAERHIAAGRSAAFAWRASSRAQEAIWGAGGSPRLVERTADLRDLERQVLAALAGETAAAGPELPAGRAIIIADELLPSQFLSLDRARIAGICTARGGATSHVAILAASIGIPMLVGAGDRVLGIPAGRSVVLDADTGILDSAPDAGQLAAIAARVEARAITAATEVQAAQSDCVMADGTRIEVFANLGSVADARAAIAAGAEGCGLLRTEFLFLDRLRAPDEAEQRDAYAAIAAALGVRPLIVRTLDIGGDKPVSYLPFAHEDNPALGARGIRFSLARRDLLEIQLRAIVAGVPAGHCRIMLPMVIEVAEICAVRAMLDRITAELGIAVRVPLGVMIETPAAAILADSLAEQAEFLSVGSNDLTQYTLAIDRGNPPLAARADALHPAVLRLIAQAAQAAGRHGRWFGICGALASDPDAARLLVGLGITELSATPEAIPAVKARLRGARMEHCNALAKRALAAHSAGQVRKILAEDRT